MRKLVIGLIPIALSACASTGGPTYSGPPPERVYEIEATASETYQGARQWIAENFKSANAVIQYEDASTNTVIGRGSDSSVVCVKPSGEIVALTTTRLAQCFNAINLEYVMKIEAKDNRFKVSFPTVNQVFPRTQYSKGGTYAASQKVVEASQDELLAYGEKIKAYIEGGVVKSSDW